MCHKLIHIHSKNTNALHTHTHIYICSKVAYVEAWSDVQLCRLARFLRV